MKNRMFFLWAMSLLCISINAESFITYEFYDCGRFGDQVVTYCKCKWLSMKYNIPMLFRPFANSEYFTCHYAENRFDPKLHSRNMVRVSHEAELRNPDPGVIYVANYCYTMLDEMDFDECYFSLLNGLKQSLQPVDFKPRDSSSVNELNVVVHIRKGSAGDLSLISEQYFENHFPSYSIFSDMDFFDHLEIVHGKRGGLQLQNKNSDAHFPGKFPPEQYYVDQLKKLELLYPDYHLKITICTDSLETEDLKKCIENAANLKNATFLDITTRSEFEDFLILLNADCLIRSSSNFSWFAELIGHHKVVLFPRYFSWQENRLLVNDIGVNLQSVTKSNNADLLEIFNTEKSPEFKAGLFNYRMHLFCKSLENLVAALENEPITESAH